MGDNSLFLVDGHSQVFKAYHAIQQLSNSAGIPTNAVFGFTQILHRLLKTRSPRFIAVVFDSPGPTFRHEYFAEYKANRPPPPEDLPIQMRYIRRIVEGLRIPVLEMQGYEADDIIATVTRKAMEQGMDVTVVTADKDLFQLVGEHVSVLRLEPDKETEFDREAVKAKMGVYPEQVLDLLAIVGDSSDNIPGIHKVGPKGATSLLEQFGSLEEILANTDKLKGKQKEYVEAGRDDAILSKRLATLCEDVPVDINWTDFEFRGPDVHRLAAVYKELEFRRYLEELEIPPVERSTNYRLITTLADLESFCSEARRCGLVALDTETDRLDAMAANLVGISLAVRPNEAVYIPLGHVVDLASASDGITQLSIDAAFPALDGLFRDPKVAKTGHNIKFDRKVLQKYGFDVQGVAFDSLLASYLLNPDKRNHGLKDLGQELLGIRMTPISELIGSGRTAITMAQVDPQRAGEYACCDADVTLQLTSLLQSRLKESGMEELFEQIELPLIDVLMDMELCGVCIDPPHFSALSREISAQMEAVAQHIFALVGHAFNLASPRQVAQVLFDELKLTPGKQKKTGYSTDVDVLEQLAQEHEVPRLLAEYRQYEKLKGTYVDVLPSLLFPPSGRIHTNYNQAVAATGRLSSSDPNLQNIPVRTELGRKIRKGFIPCQPGHVLLAADYSQIELRVLAHITKDPGLEYAFQHNQDVHTLTASKVFGTSPNLVSEEMRDQAKVINFGIIYGMSPHGLSQNLKIPVGESRKFIDEYFKAYAGVRAWIDNTLETARKQGYVMTLSGRRRYLADINSRNFNARSAAERVAINAPIQGSSADMIKIAMIRIYRHLKDSDLRTRMIMQVHDELIFDVPKDELPDVEPMVRRFMQEALPLDVPVRVDIKTGTNWAEC